MTRDGTGGLVSAIFVLGFVVRDYPKSHVCPGSMIFTVIAAGLRSAGFCSIGGQVL